MLGRIGLGVLGLVLAVLVISAGVGVAGTGDTPRPVEVVYIATGANFPDALGAGPAAGLDGGPILLVQQNAVPGETLAELNRLQPRLIVIVGGTAVVSAGVATTLEGLAFGPTVIRLAGSNRYGTAAAVSEAAFLCSGGEVFAGYGRSGPQCRAPLSGLWSLQAIDTTDNVGRYASLVLDGFGHPVIAYHDVTNTQLKLAHCNDASCTGGDETIRVVDTDGFVGEFASLVLDASGYPVIAYYDATNTQLMLAHCNDAACDGGNETIRVVDTTDNVGYSASLVLDASGNPVIAYFDITNTQLKLAHCNDAACDGGDETIRVVDTDGNVGQFASLVLDASGNPVIAYQDASIGDLKLAHCNDAACDGGNETIRVVDTGGLVGWYASLVLDASGNPVIAYFDASNTQLKLAHCNDAVCDGGNETIRVVDTDGSVGWFASLVLDAAGNPVIAYYDDTNTQLKLAHCNDAACDGSDETTRVVDTSGSVGLYASLVLDAAGNPVIAYQSDSSRDLKLAST